MAAANKAGTDNRVDEVDDTDADSSSNGHCRCCHCGAPGPEGSSSQNYLRMKKHLQQMLEEKRSSVTPERELASKIAHLNLDDHQAMEEIDSLVNFIEGRQHETGMGDPKKAAKKARKKQRRLEEEERAKQQQAKQAPATVRNSTAAETGDHVPNGMVRIKHNPLTNSTVITPLYGPTPPSSNFFPHQHTAPPATVIANGPIQRQVTQQKAAAKPTVTSRDAPVPVPTTPPVLASPQPQIPPSSSSGSSAAPQMVTIRRVMTNLADPVVTVTLKGDTSESDRVLFTLVNGQVHQQSSVPGAAAVPVAPSPPKPRPPKPVVSETELAVKQEQRKVKKKQKKLEKKEKKRNSKNSNAPQQQQPQQQQQDVVVQQSPVVQPQEPPRFHAAQYQNHFHSDNFSLDNLKLPPGITLTRVQEAHSFDTRQQQFPFQLLGTPSSKGKSTATDNKSKTFNAASPIIVSQPNAEPLGSFGGLAAPNVIVVDTRQIQEEQHHKQSSGRNPPVKMRSIGIQTGCNDSEEEETDPAAEGLSRKQKKKLRKKEKKAQHIQEAKRREQLTKNPVPPAKTAAAGAPPPSGRLINGVAEPKVGGEKRGKKKASKNHSRTDDKWEESIFAPKSDLDLERGDMDDDERELEAFKRFCFNSVPPERKEKVRVHLNVKDIFGKKPSLAANCK